MSRVVKKKVIDESLEFSDNFDENMLDRIEDELSRSTTAEPKTAGRRQATGGQPADKGAGPEEAGPTAAAPRAGGQAQSAAPEDHRKPLAEGAEDSPQKQLPIYKRIALKRWLALGGILLFFVLLPALAWIRIQHQRGAVPLIQFVRHPLPVPHLQLESKFLMIASSGTKKDLVEMVLEFEFLNTSAFEKFKNGQTAIQDSCFRYMQTHNPPESSQKYWAKLVQQEMLSHLRTDFPKIHIEAITLTQFNRL
jgi:hypothetical protein